MKLFLILIYLTFVWHTNAQIICNNFLRFGCVKTTTPVVPEVTDVTLKSSPDSDPPVEPSTEQKPTSEAVTTVNEVDVIENTEPSNESTNEDHSMAYFRKKGEKRKALLKSFASDLKKQAGGEPALNDKNQEVFLNRYYKALQNKFRKSDKGKRGKASDVDVNLRAFKGGTKEQTEREQKETDSFFSQFKNYLGKTCFMNIGCFSATEYNDFSNRPIPMLPMSPDSISPVFHMYTLESRSIPRNYSYNATKDQLRYSTFNPKLKTAFIVHGFQSGYALWMENLKDFILYRSEDTFNVVVVVWEKGSKVPMYNLAATNTRVVGACIGFFIETLCKTFNISNEQFYLIGHSLGGHIIGYAAKRLLEPKVARLTALDPAGVGFHFTNPAMRLDSTDGTMVTAIHTDGALIFSEGFGTQDTLGHYDFYPNGGTWQPGCPESGSVAQKLGSITSGKDITCSHSRACLLLNNLDKPEDDCSAVAYQCSSYEVFLEGRCADCRENKCELMAIDFNYWDKHNKPNNKTLNKKYYVNTSHREEYCLQHYQFGFHITNDSDSCTGTLHLNLKMSVDTNDTKEINIYRIMSKTTQRKIHTILVNFDFRFDKILAIDLKWKRFPSSERLRVNRGFKLKIPYIEINYMSHMNESVREKHSSVVCATNPIVIANKGKTQYKQCNPDLKERADNTVPEKMAALEWREDIYAVDYLRLHRVFHKVANTRVREKIDKYASVN